MFDQNNNKTQNENNFIRHAALHDHNSEKIKNKTKNRHATFGSSDAVCGTRGNCRMKHRAV